MLFYLTTSLKGTKNYRPMRTMPVDGAIHPGAGSFTQRDIILKNGCTLTSWQHVKELSSRFATHDRNDLTKALPCGQTGLLGDYKEMWYESFANNPATPWFIYRKLFTFFVYENPQY